MSCDETCKYFKRCAFAFRKYMESQRDFINNSMKLLDECYPRETEDEEFERFKFKFFLDAEDKLYLENKYGNKEKK